MCVGDAEGLETCFFPEKKYDIMGGEGIFITLHVQYGISEH